MPILNANTLEFVSRSPDQTRRLGMRLGALLQRGDVICLAGDLGSGKTTLVQGIGHGWGSPDTVISPTFILVNTYYKLGGDRLYHLDAYRLTNARQAEELDIVPLVEDGILVVEWAERIKEVLPPQRLWIEMQWVADEQRNLIFKPSGERNQSIVSEFRKRAFGG